MLRERLGGMTPHTALGGHVHTAVGDRGGHRGTAVEQTNQIDLTIKVA